MAKRETAKSRALNSVGSRKRKATRIQKRKAAKKEVKSINSLPGSFRLVGQSARLIWQNWRIFGLVMLVFVLLNLLFANGFSNVSSAFTDIKNAMSDSQSLGQAFDAFTVLVQSSSGGTTSSSTLQTMLIILQSLVVIWILRQLVAGEKVTLKQSFYNSTTPLIPFLLIVFLLIIQLLPLVLVAILGLVLSSLIANENLINILLIGAFIPIASWSLYMISSTIFGLYIVTLPGMQPRQALKSAKNLIRFRRFSIIRKLLMLPVFILLGMCLLMVPLILFAKALVTPVYFGLGILIILAVHTYLYNLYRSLLK